MEKQNIFYYYYSFTSLESIYKWDWSEWKAVFYFYQSASSRSPYQPVILSMVSRPRTGERGGCLQLLSQGLLWPLTLALALAQGAQTHKSKGTSAMYSFLNQKCIIAQLRHQHHHYNHTTKTATTWLTYLTYKFLNDLFILNPIRGNNYLQFYI